MEYVYFLGNANSDDTAIKIGVTYDIAKRVHQLQSIAPFRLACIEYIAVTDGRAYEIERTLHRILRGKRLKGEWFDIKKSDIMPAVEEMARQLALGELIVHDHKGVPPPPGRPAYQTQIRSATQGPIFLAENI